MPTRFASRGNILALGALCALTAISLTGCNPANRAAMTPTERAIDDYAHYSCLSATAYDLSAGNQGKASVTPPSAVYNPETDVLVITPVQGESLSLTGFDEIDRPVQPYDTVSKNILATYGCDTGPYIEAEDSL